MSLHLSINKRSLLHCTASVSYIASLPHSAIVYGLAAEKWDCIDASNHHKIVDKAVCLAVKGTGGESVMQSSSSTSSLQSGKVTASTICFPSPAVEEFLV